MLRGIFNEVAELYDRARPRYPHTLVAELTGLAALGPGVRVLEIGPGTGQLTVPLAESGCDVTAVELGPSTAEVARRNLRPYPDVRVEVADFEQWPLPAEPFDLVVSATAFHWLDPATRIPKVARALRPGGLFAMVTTEHVRGGTIDFFARAQECYERWDPATPPDLRLQDESEIATDTGELAGWDDLRSYRCTRDITYATQEYVDVLLTYSGHRALDAPSREGLLGCIRELIDTRYGGRITKCYLHELITARKPVEGDGS
ncbi:Methyltransferase domain protein [Streptomyces graminofaciens]|uniref:Methyltransferase domain protein n=1 Tax=Streptomyces graminofaciens TaxID=68212 RepID=A0ABN5V7L1_9ACTN|nr:class I SAM-dependent methyltransferase [Streptomyces graminofaciens]BBC29290.1 Methyltransferase domain protein [Streptomyces graminofaciens]